MLGINYHEIESNSVGNKEDYIMHSMDFEEFLEAKGYGSNVIDDMLSHIVNFTPFNQLEMSTYHALFLDYCVLGGLPEIVSMYIEQGTFEGTLQLQRQINLDYEEDVRKYLTGLEQTKVLNIYRCIASQLAKENKKFQISKVARGAKNHQYRGSIDWLDDAGIINVCYCLDWPSLPLKGNIHPNKYKIYYADTGMMIANLDDEAQDDLRANKNLGIYKGALYENFVCEALKKQNYPLSYYIKENSTLEIDFLIRSKDYLIPIEVKASNNKAKSLSTMISSHQYQDVQFGIKLSYGNIGLTNNIISMPYFCAFLMRRFIKEMDNTNKFYELFQS